MPRYPSLFQINTRVWLNRLSRNVGKDGRPAIDDIDPDRRPQAKTAHAPLSTAGKVN